MKSFGEKWMQVGFESFSSQFLPIYIILSFINIFDNWQKIESASQNYTGKQRNSYVERGRGRGDLGLDPGHVKFKIAML